MASFAKDMNKYLRMTLTQRWGLSLRRRRHCLRSWTRVCRWSLTAFIVMLRTWRVRMAALVTSWATGNGACRRLRRSHRLPAAVVFYKKCCQSRFDGIRTCFKTKWMTTTSTTDAKQGWLWQLLLAGPLRTASSNAMHPAADAGPNNWNKELKMTYNLIPSSNNCLLNSLRGATDYILIDNPSYDAKMSWFSPP